MLVNGISETPVFGNWVEIGTTGFTCFAVAGGRVVGSVAASFGSAVVAGNNIYVGINRETLKVVVHKDGGAVLEGGDLGVAGLSAASSLYALVFATFGTSSPVLPAGLSWQAGADQDGHSPLMTSGDAVPPVGAADGMQYKVTSPGHYKGVFTKTGDRVRFENGLNDLWVSRLPVEEDYDPNQVVGLDYSATDATLVMTMRNGESLETIIEIPPSGAGFVAIADVTPQAGGNISGKNWGEAEHYTLTSCTSSSHAVVVHVLAVTGTSHFKPAVSVAGVAVTNLTRQGTSDVWAGSAAVDTGGALTVTATHADGPTAVVAIAYETLPLPATATLSGLYPHAVDGQTRHAAGQTATLTVTADTDFVALEVLDDGVTAGAAASHSFTATQSKSVAVVFADRGATDALGLPIRFRIQAATGTWSLVTATSNTVDLNNTRPTASLGTPVYNNGYRALAKDDTADVSAVASNYDSIAFASSVLTIPLDTTFAATKTVTCNVDAYNTDVPNLTLTASRAANATQAVASRTVALAGIAATVALSGLPAKMRSGPVGLEPGYTLTATADQILYAAPTLTAPAGTWASAFVSADSGRTWTRTLKVRDDAAKGDHAFAGFTAVNLAGKPVVTVTGTAYNISGFIKRVVSFPVYQAPTFNRMAVIGTVVGVPANLLATNLSKGVSGQHNVAWANTKVDNAVNGPYTYAVVAADGSLDIGGAYIYNNDAINAQDNRNPSALVQFEIEEVV